MTKTLREIYVESIEYPETCIAARYHVLNLRQLEITSVFPAYDISKA